MGRKHGKSEYQRSFLFPSEEYARSIQEEMHTYRCIRRQKEAAHSELRWSSSETGSSDNSGTVSPIQSVIHPQEAADEEFSSTSPCNEAAVDPAPSEEQRVSDAAQRDEVILTKQQGTSEDRHFRKLKKRKPNSAIVDDKPPFVTYGWADQELVTARKLTHNVKANHEYVYPAALKKKRHQQLKKRQRVEARAESRASIAAALVCRKKAVLHDVWMTEYQRCYSRGTDRPASSSTGGKSQRDLKGKRPVTR